MPALRLRLKLAARLARGELVATKLPSLLYKYAAMSRFGLRLVSRALEKLPLPLLIHAWQAFVIDKVTLPVPVQKLNQSLSSLVSIMPNWLKLSPLRAVALAALLP